ncbi:MAG: PEP-CTERM sorting domain-containing protein, partial [Coleofasciculus sp. S288]|nr:PEP-CTERM sorting domain-containing protein [Coleofasciculus sp. S288]
MELKLGFANYLLCFVTPLVTSSIFAASPSLAATLVSSEARVFLDDFSHKPFAVSTLTDADTVAIASNGGVAAEAEADASAAFLSKMGVVENFSSSLVKGNGDNYFGMAKSIAEVIAYDFRIKAKKTFSFDFLAFLGLETSTDN